jgi:hypothetical protein
MLTNEEERSTLKDLTRRQNNSQRLYLIFNGNKGNGNGNKGGKVSRFPFVELEH